MLFQMHYVDKRLARATIVSALSDLPADEPTRLILEAYMYRHGA
jgi:hypothetical protein